jgi:NTE family protein
MAVDPSGITIDAAAGGRGYQRAPELQEQFDAAKQALLSEDGWTNPDGRKELVADLALEGGGVKGIGLVGAVLVLDEAGYRFRGVAGTSAGSIAASLIASLTVAGQPMTRLREFMDELQFSNFMPEGKLHSFLDHRGGKIGSLAADAAILSHKMGLYPGTYLEEWLGPILEELECETFANLRLPTGAAADRGQSLPAGHDYRLVVHVSDITREQLVRLPWDYPIYGHDPDSMNVVTAVRASMSIPFFFEPVTFEAKEANVDVPRPDGRWITQHYADGTCTWVDGGMLRNFPIDAFDRDDGGEPRWPTIGIKLSSLQTSFPTTQACKESVAVGVHCLQTMMNEWDTYSIDASTAGRTIFVDNGGLEPTDFNLTSDQKTMLFSNGVSAATEFIIEMAANSGVPRTGGQASDLVRRRLSLRAS